MEIHLNDWEFDDLKIELRNMKTVEILEKYTDIDKEYSEMCRRFVKSGHDKEVEKKCNSLYQKKLIIASKLADKLCGIESTI